MRIHLPGRYTPTPSELESLHRDSDFIDSTDSQILRSLGKPIPGPSPPILYLDLSVVIDLAEGKFLPLWNALRDAQARGVVVPFSVAHLIDSGIDDRDLNPDQAACALSRMAFLSDLTRDHFLLVGEEPADSVLYRKSPQRMRRLSQLMAPSLRSIRTDTSGYSLQQMKDARQRLDLNPNLFNNIKPPGVVKQLDEALQHIAVRQGMPDPVEFSIGYFLEHSTEIFPNGMNPGISGKVAGCMLSLDFLGYFPDRPGRSTAWSAATDGAHASTAAGTEALVTSDRNFRLKALASYEHLGITTQVLTPVEAITFVEGCAR